MTGAMRGGSAGSTYRQVPRSRSSRRCNWQDACDGADPADQRMVAEGDGAAGFPHLGDSQVQPHLQGAPPDPRALHSAA